MVIKLVSTFEAEQWLKEHREDKRHYYLHPHQLEYKSPLGAIIRPLAESTWNVDDDELLNKAKRELLCSEYFKSLSLEERDAQIQILGVSEELWSRVSSARPHMKYAIEAIRMLPTNYLKA